MPLGSSVWRLSILKTRLSTEHCKLIDFHVVHSLLLLCLLMRETHHFVNHIHIIHSYTIRAHIFMKSIWVLVFYIRRQTSLQRTLLNIPVASDPTSGKYQAVTDLKRDPSNLRLVLDFMVVWKWCLVFELQCRHWATFLLCIFETERLVIISALHHISSASFDVCVYI